jgi:hypothetical protein
MKHLSCKESLALVILFSFLSQHVVGQQPNIPTALDFKTYNTIPITDLLEMDTATFFTKFRQHASNRIISETVAFNFKTDFTPNKEGRWKTVVPGIDSWFLKLRSSNAYGLALVFTDVALLPGETLFIYNQHALRGPYTNENVPRSGILPLDFLQGDEIMIEYDVPIGSQPHRAFIVETVSHAFQNIFKYTSGAKTTPSARTANTCYLCIDDATIEQERRSVVKLAIVYDSITKFCTGTLVNNTAHDQKPYILTAQHCVTNQFDADRTTVIFGFEDIDCVGSTHYNDFVLSGAYFRASLFENDFSLLELYHKPPLEFHPYYAGWDISDKYLDGVTSIHHPQGGPKKISISNGEVKTGTFNDVSSRAQNAFWNVEQWDVGVTEGGSSGAALFNKNSNVMGTLSGGSSACGAPYNDYFEKLSASWEASPDPGRQLRFWLDPIGSGVQSFSGNDPFEGIHATCNTISNVKSGEQQHLLLYTKGSGYFSGFNSDNIASYAEKFSTVDSAMLTGVTLNVGSVNTQSPGGLLVSILGNSNGLPGPLLSSTYIPYDRFTKDSTNYIELYPYVKLIGDFFISYTLSYSPADSFALKQVDWRSNSSNTAFVKLSTGWAPMNSISPSGAGSSLGIKIALCENSPEPPHDEAPISFYPNPVTTVLIGKLPENAGEETNLQVYDLQGKLQTVKYNTFENNVVITTADLSPGMYIVKLSTTHDVYQSKFVKL